MEEDEILEQLNDGADPPAPEIQEEPQAFEYDPSQVYENEEGQEVKLNAEGVWEVVAPVEPAPVAETAPEPVAEAKPYTPPAPALSIPGMPDEVRERLNELAITDPVAAAAETYRYMAAQDRQAQAVAEYFVEQQAAVSPDFVRVHGKAMQAHLATMPPEKRATKEAAEEAAMVAVWREAQQTGDLAGTFLRNAELFKKQQAKVTTPPAPPRVIPRATTPTVAPAGGIRPRGNIPADVKMYMELEGVSRDEAQRIVDLQRRSR